MNDLPEIKYEFFVDQSEYEEAIKWKNSHKCSFIKKILMRKLNINQEFFYSFHGENGIGYGVQINCNCGKNKDITNYDRW